MDSTSDSMGYIKELILSVDKEIRSIFIIFILCILIDNYILLPKIIRMMESNLNSEILLYSILVGHVLLIIIIILCAIAIIIHLFIKIKYLLKSNS